MYTRNWFECFIVKNISELEHQLAITSYKLSCSFYSASNNCKCCLGFEYECVVQEIMKIGLKIFPCNLKTVYEILMFSVFWGGFNAFQKDSI